MMNIPCCYIEFEPGGQTLRVMSLRKLGPPTAVLTISTGGRVIVERNAESVSTIDPILLKEDILLFAGQDVYQPGPPSNKIYTGNGD